MEGDLEVMEFFYFPYWYLLIVVNLIDVRGSWKALFSFDFVVLDRARYGCGIKLQALFFKNCTAAFGGNVRPDDECDIEARDIHYS